MAAWAQRGVIRRELEGNTLRERLKTAEQAIEKAVIEKEILLELRSIINEELRPSYTVLTISTAPGLAEVLARRTRSLQNPKASFTAYSPTCLMVVLALQDLEVLAIRSC